MSEFTDTLLQDIFVGAIVMFPNPRTDICYDYGVVSCIDETRFTVETLTRDSIMTLEAPIPLIQDFMSAYKFIEIHPEIMRNNHKKAPRDWKQFLLSRSLELIHVKAGS